MNFFLVKDSLLGNYPIFYKVKILFSLLLGMWTSMTLPSLLVLFIIALLTGANITLILKKISTLKKFGKLQLVVGGNTLLGVIGSGCATCGLPVISLLNLSGSLIFLPYHGAELSYLSFILLSISLYMLIKSRNQSCTINYEKHGVR